MNVGPESWSLIGTQIRLLLHRSRIFREIVGLVAWLNHPQAQIHYLSHPRFSVQTYPFNLSNSQLVSEIYVDAFWRDIDWLRCDKSSDPIMNEFDTLRSAFTDAKLFVNPRDYLKLQLHWLIIWKAESTKHLYDVIDSNGRVNHRELKRSNK